MAAEAPLPHRAYAGLVSRLAALIVDVALLGIGIATVRLLPPLVWEEIYGRTAPSWLSSGAGLVAAALPWLYFTVCWWLTNQTVGDLVIGIEVRNTNGGGLSLPHAALRAAVGLLLAPVWMVGLLSILWDRRRRAWHDRVLRTVVRYTPKARGASA